MAGVAGKSGRKDKHWRDALSVAVKRIDSEGKVLLAKIAEACVDAAVNGDLQAMKEIGDRLDGRAIQSIDIETTETRYVINARAEKPTRDEWTRQHSPTETTKTVQ